MIRVLMGLVGILVLVGGVGLRSYLMNDASRGELADGIGGMMAGFMFNESTDSAPDGAPRQGALAMSSGTPMPATDITSIFNRFTTIAEQLQEIDDEHNRSSSWSQPNIGMTARAPAITVLPPPESNKPNVEAAVAVDGNQSGNTPNGRSDPPTTGPESAGQVVVIRPRR